MACKLLVGSAYQLLLSAVVLAINGGFVGQVPLVVLFALLGCCFGIALGLLIGGFVQTTSATGAVVGIMSLIYILPIFFVGTFSQLFGNNSFTSLIKILPTYYIADGATNALQSQSTFGGTLLDVGVILSFIIVLFLVAIWFLRRQATVVSTI